MTAKQMFETMVCFRCKLEGAAPVRESGKEWKPDVREKGKPCGGRAIAEKMQVGPGVWGWIVKCAKCGNRLVYPCDSEEIAILQWNHIACVQNGKVMPKAQEKKLREWIDKGREIRIKEKIKAKNPGKNVIQP